MVRCASLFSQLLAFFPRHEFARIVSERRAERYAKGFSSWDQFVAMLFCQLAQAHSLREICGGLRSTLGKLSHLGLRAAPNRSTLSYANAHRSWEIYRDLFYQLLERGQAMVPARQPLRIKNKLLSLDATTIDLCLELFPWAKFRQTKGAVKLHLVLDHDGYLPVFAQITEGRTHEAKVARDLHFPRGSLVVVDRGYVDYRFFSRLCDDKVFFVTRLKRNAVFEVVSERELPKHRPILADQIIRIDAIPFLLRRVVIAVPDKPEPLVLLTNHLDFGPTTIARIYKERWQIEIFFKTIKQNLRIKTFVGTSKNALHTQIWTALIAILLLKILALASQRNWSLSTLVAFLRWNLFTYRELWTWLDHPFQPPLEPPGVQQQLPLFGQHIALTA